MRKRGRKKRLLPALLLLLLALPAAVSLTELLRGSGDLLGELTRQTALAAALYQLPEESLELLEQRFGSQLESQPPPEQPPTAGEEDARDSPDWEERPHAPPSPQTVPGASSPAQDQAPPAQEEPTPQDQQPTPPPIPQEYQGPVIEEDMSGRNAKGLIPFGSGLIKNTTALGEEEVRQLLEAPNPISLPRQGPQVLIMHTHATESFEPYDAPVYDTRNTWRTTDNQQNVVAVGEQVAQGIRSHGIQVLHDQTQHDYPSYNGSYQRSAQTVEEYLEKYPSIRVVLDVHRDAVQRDATLVKPVATIQGRKTAQVMIIAGCDDGTMEMPHWQKNLRFAAGLQDRMEERYPGLTRPVFFCYRKYNQHLTTGSLLLEFGSHGNTLEEVLTAAQMAGDAIGSYLAQLL